MAELCAHKKCKNTRTLNGSRFCYSHRTKASISGFLSNIYTRMNQRVRGGNTRRPDLYKGLPIMPKNVFLTWSRNHPDFLRLYKQWVTSDFDRRLTPTLNRMNSNKGYTLGNVEWLTNSQNCGLSAGVLRMKARKEIYELLGVK